MTVVSYGSEGDTRPLAAVCRGLIDAGHEAYLFCERSSLAIVRDQGIPAQALAGDIKTLLPSADSVGADSVGADTLGTDAARNPGRDARGRHLLKAVMRGTRLIRRSTAAWTAAVAAEARGADMLLISGLASPMGHAVAAALNKPAMQLWLQPTTPTREFPSPVLPPWRLPGWANRLSYVVSPSVLMNRLGAKAAAEACVRELGATGSVDSRRRVPILYGFSRHLVQPPRDWGGDLRVCGAWTLSLPQWQPSPELSRFLAAGPAPLYVGFGSVSSFVGRRRLNEIIAAIGGRRAVFYPGWSDVGAEALPDNFFVVGHTSHAWLFPRMSLIIHHCGAGTSHAAAAAGVPSVGLPVGTDQAFWAGRLAAAGVAPAFVPATRIDARSLSRMIDFAERDEVRERARVLGVAMSAENGVADAVEAIEAESRRVVS